MRAFSYLSGFAANPKKGNVMSYRIQKKKNLLRTRWQKALR